MRKKTTVRTVVLVFYTDTVLYKLNIAIKVSEWYNTEKIKSFQAKYEKRY